MKQGTFLGALFCYGAMFARCNKWQRASDNNKAVQRVHHQRSLGGRSLHALGRMLW